MKVSVVVTVRNEERTIGGLLETLRAQTRRPDEIVIVDGGSTDRTVELIRRWERDDWPIRLLECPGVNIAAGRNRAIEAATGDVIACTDAGVRLVPGWLERIVRPCEAGAAVSMGFFVADPRSRFERALGATTLPDVTEVDPTRFVPSSRSIAFRRGAWQAVNGYPEWLDYCEDVVFDLALRKAGCRFAWAPDAIAYFRPRTSAGAFFRQYYRYARGDGKANLWPRRHLIRYLTYLVSPLVLIAGFWYKPTWLALIGGAGLYLYRPYRRLSHRPITRPFPNWAEGGPSGDDDPRPGRSEVVVWLLVPGLRFLGDLAKMIGYPVGVWWRIRREAKGG
ncbi:MAG: glycosyltransferase [Chloroflexota bacterium]